MGHFVDISQRPQWKSVEKYKKYLKKNSPNTQLQNIIMDPDIECTCCGQGAPSEAAALIRCEDHTPVTINLQGDKGEILWICADCFFHGVRPKYVKYGEIQWNQEGRRIKNRAEKHGNSPW